MNRIYRRLWNRARQCWVVASELAPSRGKASVSLRAGGLVLLSLLVVPAAGASEDEEDDAAWWARQTLSAFAATTGDSGRAFEIRAVNRGDVYSNTSRSNWSVIDGKESMALGSEARASGEHSLAAGISSRAAGARSVTLGSLSEAWGDNSIALGHYAITKNGGYGTAVGTYSEANGTGATALGQNAKARTENSIAVGSGSMTDAGAGISKIAIGGNAYAGTGGFTGAIAIGGESNSGYDGVSLGYGAKAEKSGSLALGSHSLANESNTVSVGNGSTKRRIVNVADARLSTTSTDAVTGKQLNATNTNVASAQTAATAAQSTANTANTNANTALNKANAVSGLVSQVSASGNVRLGGENTGTVLDVRNKSNANRRLTGLADAALTTSSTEAVTGKQLTATNANVSKAQVVADAVTARLNASAVALGAGAVAEQVSYGISTALGNNAKAYNGKSVAMGADARATVDDAGNKISGNAGVSIGAGTRSGNGAVALGLDAVATGDRGIAVGHEASGKGTYATALGFQSNASANQATAVGRGAVASSLYASAVGNQANATAQSALALGDRASATHAGAVALGNGSTTTATNQVSVGNGSLKRKVVNVADGALSTSSSDAVTGKQLHATNTSMAAVKVTADGAQARVAVLDGLVGQVSASGNVRVGAENTGTIIDVANKAGTRRKLQNLANGVLSTSSTDAVTGQQLNATNSEVTSVRTAATAAKTAADAARGVADGAVQKADALAGLVGQVSATGNVRLGGENTGTVLDVRNKSNAVRSISGVKDGALGTSSTEAVTGKQLHATNSSVAAVKTTADGALARVAVLDGLVGQVSASGNLRLGADNTGTVIDVANKTGAKRKLQNLANGVLSTSSTDAVTGQQLNATNSEVTSVRTAATAAKTAADAARGVADGAVQKADALGGLVGQVSASGNVRLGAENTGTIVDVANKSGGKRRIYNIANGTLSAGSTDAVTGQQLFATNATVETQRQALAGHAQQLTDQDGRIADNRVELDALRTDFDNFDPDLDGVVKFSADRLLVDMEGARVSGVAAGDISSATSTDAVNGGQLYATNLALRKIEERGEFVQVGWDAQSSRAEAASLAVAIGSDAKATGSGATAIGAYSLSSGFNSVAIGRGSQVALGAEGGFALGSGTMVAAMSGVAIGVASQIASGADGAVALGATSIATEANVVSVGNDTMRRRIVNIDRGRGGSDAVVVAQLRESLAVLGGGATLDEQGNVIGPMYSIQGGVHSTVGEALTTLDSAVVTTGSRVDRVETQLRSVFQETPSTRSDGTAQLTLAGANGMVISNVANGLIAAGSDQAVNGGQLHAVQQQLNGRMDGLEQRVDGQPQSRALATASAAPTEQVTPTPEASDSPQAASAGEGTSLTPQPNSKQDDTPSPAPQVDTAELEKMLARANEYTDGAISNFERRLDKMDKRFNRMAAMSSAQTAMAMNTAGLATYNRLGAGVGYAEGESAMAVGYQRVLNDKGSATFSLNGAFTNSGERSMGVGVGIGW
ncbi:TPA: YadA-like family protein [Stenotrophomonas maltophilia]|nr:YadA-like family protein [Stenotrophomonas maltophilia]